MLNNVYQTVCSEHHQVFNLKNLKGVLIGTKRDPARYRTQKIHSHGRERAEVC